MSNDRRPQPPQIALDDALGHELAWARIAGSESTEWLLLAFRGSLIVRVESAHDGVGLQCARVAAAPPQVQPVPTVFDACVGKALIAVRPLPLEYDSQLDGVGPSRFVLEFDGGRRVCVSNVSGEIVCDRTGKAGGQLAG